MDSYYPLIITFVIILLPLVPATIIYLLLTPNSAQSNNEARGEYEGKFLNFGKVRIEFNVFGSSATYLLVLFASYYIHHDMELQNMQKLAMVEQQAWLVDVPVKLKDSNYDPIEANNEEMQQVMVTLEPRDTDASATRIQFWVFPQKGKFPTANFSMLGARNRVTIDLNDQTKINYNHASKTMERIVPVWLELGETYGQ